MSDEPVRRIGVTNPDASDHVDPDLAPPRLEEQRAPVLTDLLAELEGTLTADVTFEPVTLEVKKRPGVSVRYGTEITDDEMTAWRKRAADKNAPDGISNLRLCCIVLASKCEAILMHGQEVTDSDEAGGGRLLTFGHARIKALYGLQPRDPAVMVVRKVYGNDAHVMLDANEVLDKAGFGDQAVEVDDEETPTGGF